MPETRREAVLTFRSREGRFEVEATVAHAGSGGETPAPLVVLTDDEVETRGEERVQLLEDHTYEYELKGARDGLRLRESGAVTRSSLPSVKHQGTIRPGSRVGLLPLEVEDTGGRTVAEVGVEVRSKKLTYREDFRQMLDEIAERGSELLMRVQSSVRGRFKLDPKAESETIAQKFAFLRSLLTSREFEQALARVLRRPHKEMRTERARKSIRRGFKPDPKTVRQLATRRPRTEVPGGHPLRERMPTVPQEIERRRRYETTDTAENRFVKHALRTFAKLLADMRRTLESTSESRKTLADERLELRVAELGEELEEKLSRDLFKDLPNPTLLPLGSPVLQRREGYRQILRAWLRFGVATQLAWEGGEKVYEGGQRDVATLYEYWLFFRLLGLVRSKFDIERGSLDNLIEKTRDGFSLKLKAGEALSVEGTYSEGRDLNVRFSYNRTFGGENAHPASGSWTRQMRPDYTLSMWPAGLEEEVAEQLELTAHLHFDAKYRIRTLGDFAVKETEESKEADRRGRVAKTSDIQRAHAYRDAIRRTEGTYLLYPGDESKRWCAYRELLPGVGAFAVRPSGEGLERVEDFLDAVVTHVSNRASRREQQRYHEQRVQDGQRSEYRVREPLPETGSIGQRALPLKEHVVLVCGGFATSVGEWLEKEELFALPLRQGRLDPHKLRADSLLLFGDSDAPRVEQAYRLPSVRDVELVSAGDLKSRGYPTAESDGGEQYALLKVQRDHDLEEVMLGALAPATIPARAGRLFTLAELLDEGG